MPKQIGSNLLTLPIPLFDDYIVVEDTWKEKDATGLDRTKSGGVTVNFFVFAPGADISCDLVIKAGAEAAPLQRGDVITETIVAPATTARAFVVVDAETSQFGHALRQTVQLAYEKNFTPTVTGE